MTPQKSKILAKARHRRVRRKVVGSPDSPRMSVKFSGHNIYVQFVDDSVGRTIASVSSLAMEHGKRRANTLTAKAIGEMAAAAAKTAGIRTVVFDRGAAKYHGKVQALADAARNGGLIF
jgi:large subunit ribosomal protein L18